MTDIAALAKALEFAVSTDDCTCTCPDFAAPVRHAGPRMPACKHLIAAFLVDLTHCQKT